MRKVLFIIMISVPFTTFALPEYDFVVSQDGTGDFKTVQEAINAVPDFRENTTVIWIESGTYKEKLILLGSKTNVTFVGEDVTKTILTYNDYATKQNSFGEAMGTTGSASFYIFGDGFTAKNITFENSAGPVGQAVAVRVDGDKVSFVNCRFIGHQDTVYAHGDRSRQYYKHCYVEGTVDFIFGWSTAVFDQCEIKMKRSSYITAASTNQGQEFGFVFLNCRITAADESITYYLGRPWRPYAQTVFINCFIDKHVRPEGWHNWNKPDAEKTSFYAEYKSIGPGRNPDARVKWSHQLTDEEAKKYTVQNIFKDWIPEVNN